MHQVSIIIPSFHHGLYLRECVASIRENAAGVQTEVIIVDDGSTDETSIRVVNDLELNLKPDSSFKLAIRRHEAKLGVQVARNTGLKAAGGDFVLCIDADDILLPIPGHQGFLSKAAELLAANPSAAFVHTLVRIFGDFNGLTISSYPLREELVVRKHHVPIAIMYRRTEILGGLRYLETVPKWQDWAFGDSLLANR